MRFRSRMVQRLATVSLALGVVGLPIVGVTAAQASGNAPSITVTPSADLANNQTVSVSGSGFPATAETVYLVECSGLTSDSCDTSTLATATTDADGSFSDVALTVVTGAVGSGSCSASSSCYIDATTSTSASDATNSAYAPISFVGPSITVTPNTGLANNQTVSVSGSGFPATAETVYLVECSGLTSDSCDTSTLATATTDADGSFSDVALTVVTGTVGSGTCDASNSCYIDATTSPSAGDATNSAYAPISFASTSPVSGVLVVTPDKELKQDEVVKVSGSGFHHAVKTVYVLECSGLDAASCDTSTLSTGQTTASGTFSNIKVTVHTGTIGDGKCTAKKSCYIIATTDTATSDPTQDGIAPITFASTVSVATKTSAKASAHKVAPGKKFTVKGRVKAAGNGVRGVKVALYKKVGKTLKRVTVQTTKAGGAFSFKLKGVKQMMRYQVKALKTTKGSKVFLGSSSKVITVK